MEKSIDLIELLKDCPSGLELYCPIFNNIYFDRIAGDKNGHPIKLYTVLEDGTKTAVSFTREGKYLSGPECKCVLFPKGKKSWKDFKIVPKVCKFKDGDVVTCKNSAVTFTAIFRRKKGDDSFFFHACYTHPSNTNKTKLSLYSLADFNKSCRLATGNEVLVLENLLRKNNFIWNSKERALRFNFSKLNHYDKVLVRSTDCDVWRVSFFSHLIKDDGKYKFSTVSGDFNFCIPYRYNKHLVGTAENCQDCYIDKK